MFFSQQDLQDAHDELFTRGLTKVTKHRVAPFIKTAFGLFSVAVVLIILAATHIHTDKVLAERQERIACRSFGKDYVAAQNALAAGATYLDANNDGIACNSIKRPK